MPTLKILATLAVSFMFISISAMPQCATPRERTHYEEHPQNSTSSQSYTMQSLCEVIKSGLQSGIKVGKAGLHSILKNPGKALTLFLSVQSRGGSTLIPGAEGAISVSGLNQNLTCIDNQTHAIPSIAITSGGRPSRATLILSDKTFGTISSTYNPGNSYNYTTFADGAWSTVFMEIYILNYFFSRLIFTPAYGCSNVSISATVTESISNYAARGNIVIRASMPNIISVTIPSRSANFSTTSASTLSDTSSSPQENATITTQSQLSPSTPYKTTDRISDSTSLQTTPILSASNTESIPEKTTSITTTSISPITLVLPMQSVDQPPYAIIGLASTVGLSCVIAVGMAAKKCWSIKQKKSSQAQADEQQSGIQNQYVNLSLVKPGVNASPITAATSSYDSLPIHQPFDYEKVFINLQEASKNGDCELIEILLGSGVPVDSINKDGYTALQLAAEAGQEMACKLLVSKGANKNVTTPEGKAALDLARENDHQGVIAFLETSS